MNPSIPNAQAGFVEPLPDELLASNGNLEYDPAQHEVPVPEITETVSIETVSPEPEPIENIEVVESGRKRVSAPPPVLPLVVAQALGEAPAQMAGGVTGGGALPNVGLSGSSAFWDDEDYYVDTVMVGSLEVRLRELCEETHAFVASINERVAEVTQERISVELSALLFNGLKGATPKQLEAVKAISPEDTVVFKDLISAMRDKAICEGINSWIEHDPQRTARPCTDENKLMLAKSKRTRDECLAKIFKATTFSEREQDFLAAS